jgi:hypothetical protein
MKSLAGQESNDDSVFLDTRGLRQRVPVSKGTIEAWRKSGLIPFVKIEEGPRGRVLFHWPSVEAALVRMQRGGVA